MKIAEYNQMMKWLTRPSRKEDYKTIKKTISETPKPQRDAAMDWVDYNMLKWQDSKHTPKEAAKLVELENRLSKTSYKNHLGILEKEEKPKKNLNKYNATQLYNDWGSKPVKKVKVSYKPPDPITEYDWRIAPWWDLQDESVSSPYDDLDLTEEQNKIYFDSVLDKEDYKPQKQSNSYGLDYLLGEPKKY